MKKLHSLFTLVFACFALNALAGPEQELSANLKAIETYSATFTQVITDPSGAEIQSTTGEVKLKKPGMFFWQVSPPYEQLVVANQQFLWVYDPDLEQVTISDRKKLDNSPAQILSGDFSSLGNQYAVTAEKRKGKKQYRLKALADTAQTFTELRFEFSKQGVLLTMQLLDKLGQTTAVNFSNPLVNAPIADSIFEFGTPAGVDIIVNE